MLGSGMNQDSVQEGDLCVCRGVVGEQWREGDMGDSAGRMLRIPCWGQAVGDRLEGGWPPGQQLDCGGSRTVRGWDCGGSGIVGEWER